MQRSLSTTRWLAEQAIDDTAADARARRLTATPGMALVHTAKLQQALAYLATVQADPLAPVPAYVAADVDVDGTTPTQAALAIVQASASFHDGAGPDIERARRAGKAAVRAADTVDAVAQAQAAAEAALRAI